MQIRPARPEDAPAITDIYNEAILNTSATFDTEPKSTTDRLVWMTRRSPRFPVLVAEEAGQVVGWGALNPWSERGGYAWTAENSIYIHADWRRKGVGQRLLAALVDEAKRHGFHVLIARIAAESEGSMRLHEKQGYRLEGTLREIGFKFGRYHDVRYLQLVLG